MKPWPSTSRRAYLAWLALAKHHDKDNILEAIQCRSRAETVRKGFLSRPQGRDRWR